MFYSQRPNTPPSMTTQQFHPDSTDYNEFYYIQTWDQSPDTLQGQVTTPPKSPNLSLTQFGPALLPKIRHQDQIVEPSAPTSRSVRAASAHVSSSLRHSALQHSAYHRRAQSPPEAFDPALYTIHDGYDSVAAATMPAVVSSISVSTTPANVSAGPMPSPCESGFGSLVSSPMMPGASLPQSVAHSRRTSLAHVRAVSQPAVPTRSHNRSASGSSVDEAAIRRHGYPTQYRQIPQYVTAAQVQTQVAAVAPLLPQQQSFPSNHAIYPSERHSSISYTQPYNVFPSQTTSLLSYMTTPNPSCSQTIRRVIGDKRNKDWFWYDVRTLRSWSSFNIDTIMSIAQFPALLRIPMDAATLPQPPAPMHGPPDTEYSLRTIYQDYFSVKVNAALKVTQGSQRHMFMEAVNSVTTSATPKPDFISNYADDVAFRTLTGDRRGRLVGIVKAYTQWNTGMRSQDPPAQVKYLSGLAHLHRVMREHGCRYGFIITEIELLCVKAGAKDAETGSTSDSAGKPVSSTSVKPEHLARAHSLDDGPLPIFGQLETSPPIPLSLSGPDPATSSPRLTATMALWYLHMLAKEDPLPGMPPWNMAVSGVAAHTRKNCGARDQWMPKVGQHEVREAKRIRGWVWPEEPVSRKEWPNKKRRGAQKTA